MDASAYIADLRYNYTGILANDCMPLGISYIKAVMDRDLPEVRSRLFAYPDRLLETIKDSPPDALMLTNYVWNESLSLHVAKLVKRASPSTLVIMGGPNISIERQRQLDFVGLHPDIDIYVLGEGDFVATAILKMYMDAGKSIKKLLSMDIPSGVYRRPDGVMTIQKLHDRARDLDDIPSPWLTGIQDEFFDGKLAPMIETNRGCPFTCSFCVQGSQWYSKITNFGMDRLREEIDYIARRVKAVCPTMGTLRIADANYGMYERDVEVSGYIGQAQKKYGYPVFIDATTGKNRADRIIKSLEKVNGALVLYQAVQSMDEGVLENTKRSQIRLDSYGQIQTYLKGRGMRSSSDLIIGLPGETLESHISALRRLIDAGTNQMHNFQLCLLKGSEIETSESRRKFSFETYFRVLPKNFGVYGGEKVFDIDEIVVSTSTLSFEDYLEVRKNHMVCSVFWNDSWFDVLVDLAGKFGIRKSEWFEAILETMEGDIGNSHKFLYDFVNETKNELFPTREACIEYYSRDDNFRRLLAGEIGDNLMYKYRALASFHAWGDICSTAMDTTERLLRGRGADSQIENFDLFWKDLSTYVYLRHASGRTAEEVLSPARARFNYDLTGWVRDGAPVATGPYRLPRPEEFDFMLTESGRNELQAALNVWTTDIKGLSKLVTRIRVESQRRSFSMVTAGGRAG